MMGNVMHEMLKFADGRPFVNGVVPYFVGEPGEETSGRLLVEVSIEGQSTIAAIDTGGFYFVCQPDLARELTSHLTDYLGETGLKIRGVQCKGNLYLLTLELHASEGESLRLSVTTFIPTLDPGQIWTLPSILGFQGALDRIRFAIDPDDSLFYFGALGET